MFNGIIKTVLAFSLLLGAGGCTSMRGARQREEASRMSETMLMQEQMQRLSGQIENTQLQIDQIWSEIERIRKSNRDELDGMADALQVRVDDLEKEIARLEAARASDKKEIVDKMTATISEIVAASAANRAGASGSQFGREHTVEAGQTLSEIAAAYGVSMRVIIDANSLSSPDKLRVGQTLFIPE